MKVLLNTMEVVKVKKIERNGIITDSGNSYGLRQIIDFQGNLKGKYVVCNRCNAVIPNTEAAIEKHTTLHKDVSGCKGCNYLTNKKSIVETKTYKRNGKCYERSTWHLEHACGRCWNAPVITEETIAAYCTKARCTRENIVPWNNIFTKYPHPFEQAITIKHLMNKANVKIIGDHTAEIKSRYQIRIELCKGIAHRISVGKGNNDIYLFYSKKYDKFFLSSLAEAFCYEKSPWWMSLEMYDVVTAKIREVFN